MDTRKIGKQFENEAAVYLQQKGYHIRERNYWCRCGEIDIIAVHEGYLIFVEVKYRQNKNYDIPAVAVDSRKRRRISKAAVWYLAQNKMSENTPCRFDIISIIPGEIVHYQNAFNYLG